MAMSRITNVKITADLGRQGMARQWDNGSPLKALEIVFRKDYKNNGLRLAGYIQLIIYT